MKALLKNKKFTALLALILMFSIVSVMFLAACKDDEDEPWFDPETRVFNIATTELDGVFSPFFYTGANDGDIVGLTQTSLLTVSPYNEIVAGPEYDTVGQSFTQDYNSTTDRTTYEIVLKNGLKFSDGTPITAEDVLFNLYVFLDPKYDGSSTLHTMPIIGLSDYRTQASPELQELYTGIAEKIIEAGYGAEYEENGDFTAEQQEDYWSNVDALGIRYAKEIVDICFELAAEDLPYLTDLPYIQARTHEGWSTAFGMLIWGFGDWAIEYEEADDGDFVYLDAAYRAYNAETDAGKTTYVKVGEAYEKAPTGTVGDYVRTRAAGYYEYDETPEQDGLQRYVEVCLGFEGFGTGTIWTMEDDDFPTLADYWTEIIEDYEGDLEKATDAECEGWFDMGYDAFCGMLTEDFIRSQAAGSEDGPVTSISGLTKGTKTVDGVEHEIITMVVKGRNPKVLLNFTISIAPKSYYTQGFNYTNDMVVNAGVPLANSAFIANMKTKNSLPIGAGPYKFVKFENNVVFFERNENFASFGLGVAKIKNISFQIVALGSELEMLELQSVDFSNLSPSGSNMSTLATIDYLTNILVDNLGYGYICINPSYANAAGDRILADLDVRIAIQTTFNLDLVYEYYANGLAEVIYRSQSQVSWAYPQDAGPVYNYDSTGAEAIARFAAAGWTQVDGKMMKNGKQFEIDFTIPSTEEHPANGIFLESKRILESIGCVIHIVGDANLTTTVNGGKLGVYALAWQAAADPDMYQVYHWEAPGSSVVGNGIRWLYNEGIKTDSPYADQAEALKVLGAEIMRALESLEPAVRAPIYKNALEMLAELAIEIPTYQRKNLFVYNSSVINSASFPEEITPYWSPLREIWNITYVGND